jgi:OmpA-OmpF porin, OOP family
MRLSKPVFWLLTLLWFAAATWWYGSCSKCTACATPATPPLAPPSTMNLPGFSVSDSSWNLSTPDHLRFGKSGNIPVLGQSMSKMIDSLTVYLTTNPNKTITVTGYYNAGETNTTSFENLGLARADELKKILVSKGVAAASVLTQSKLTDDLVFAPADTLVGGITMDITSAAIPVQDLFAPRTVYFNTGKNSLPVDAAFTNYIEEANTYLQNNPGKQLQVTGYTDNVGDAEKNMQLSASRAAFVKAELVKKGIAANRIESSGKGMNDPVADNNTAEGRATNRRVTIQLQ